MNPPATIPDGRKRASAILGWSAAVLIAVALSWSMPMFSSRDPAGGTLSFPRLYPVYYQSNVDAPLEMHTCLGFPGYFREDPYRISRPTLYAALAGIRNLVVLPAASLFLGPATTFWVDWPARDYVATYLLWLLANLAFLLAALRMAHAMVSSRLPRSAADLSALMLLTTPIILLALREIHLNAFQIFTGIASLAFWEALIAGRLSGRNALLAALGLGLAFLGKPSLNLFGAGAALCILLGQGRRLLLVLPAVALPTVLWMAAVKAMGLEYGVPEVTEWRAGVWIFQVGAGNAAKEFALYTSQWVRVLGESLTPAHLLFAAAGAYSLWSDREAARENTRPPGLSPGRVFLALAVTVAAADFVFYFLVHRVHAVYYVGTLLGIFALAATGLVRGLDLAAGRLNPALGGAARERIALAAVIVLQAALAMRQLPRYPG